MKRETITATVKLAIVKPADGDWDELGRALRALRAPLHRALNATVRELELGPRDLPWWEPTAKSAADGRKYCSPRTASYRVARDTWKREREEAAARVGRGKGYSGDDAIASIEPASDVVLGAASAAYARWCAFNKARWRGDMSLPSFRGGGPIYVSGGGVGIRALDGNLIVRLALDRWREVIVLPDGPGPRAVVARLLDGAYKLGDARIAEERDRRSNKVRWCISVAYTFPRPAARDGITMAIHRGVRSMLTLAVTRSSATVKDAYTEILETGDDVLRHKKAYRARRRSLGMQSRQSGRGAHGHGKARRLEHITRIGDAEARWVRSKCQEIAAHVMRRAARFGVARILVEEWGNPAHDGAPVESDQVEYMIRSFPLAQLRDSIVWAAKLRGVEVDVVRTDNNSSDCPACGHKGEAPQSGKFRCASCQLERPSDVIFAWNMLRRAGLEPGIEEAINAGKRISGRLRRERAANEATR